MIGIYAANHSGAILFQISNEMANFRKQEDCPASQTLLAYQLGDLESSASRSIGRHLAVCEFCSSEVKFYEHYPPVGEHDDTHDSVEMPEPLYELAEALLNRNRSSPMDEIMKELESVPGERL